MNDFYPKNPKINPVSISEIDVVITILCAILIFALKT